MTESVRKYNSVVIVLKLSTLLKCFKESVDYKVCTLSEKFSTVDGHLLYI